jgi:hypothetical protein
VDELLTAALELAARYHCDPAWLLQWAGTFVAAELVANEYGITLRSPDPATADDFIGAIAAELTAKHAARETA